MYFYMNKKSSLLQFNTGLYFYNKFNVTQATDVDQMPLSVGVAGPVLAPKDQMWSSSVSVCLPFFFLHAFPVVLPLLVGLACG